MSRPTINDVAQLAGVSKKTVSRVINNSPLIAKDTREKIERIIAETGFVPDPTARALALKRNFLVALVHDDPLSSALMEVQAGMLTALAGSEYALGVHCLAPRSHPQFRLRALGDFLEYHRPSGLVLMPPLSASDQLAGLAWEYGCGCARLGAEAKPGDPGRYPTDDREAAASAVHHLIGLGHRRIGFIAGAEDERQSRLRELGYLDAMADHGLDRGPSLIASGDGGFEAALGGARLLLEVSPRPSAILAASDEMAAGAIHAALSKGIAIPQALSVIGFGDTPLASRIWPPLSSVRVPLMELAHAATSWLIAPDAQVAAHAGFAMELIQRETVSPFQANSDEPSSFAFQSG